MALAEDRAAVCRFKPDVLSAQQITGFFGRRAAKKRLMENTALVNQKEGGKETAKIKNYQSDLSQGSTRNLSYSSNCIGHLQCVLSGTF